MKNKNHEGKVSLFALLLSLMLALLVPVAVIGWKELYNIFFEANGPSIFVRELPRGIGEVPTRLVVEFEDLESGIDEIVIRAVQHGETRELERRSLNGVNTQTVTLNFPGRKSGFQEGSIDLEIRAFDRSMWSNRSEHTFTLPVDYGAPSIEVVSTQHNARIGGSQLLVYRAVDESLTVSGVKVNNQVFIGFPARLLDPSFEKQDLFAVLYALPLELASRPGKKAPQIELSLFAEDTAGNATREPFYSKEARRQIRPRKQEISSNCLRSEIHPLAERHQEKLSRLLEQPFLTRPGSKGRYEEEFIALERYLRPLDRAHLRSLTRDSRFKRYWNQSFLKQSGVVRYGMAEQLAFFSGKEILSSRIHEGYFFRSSHEDVLAANNGVVSFVEELDTFGKSVGVDHGLGLTSVYTHLSQVQVRRGESVKIGEPIGKIGKTGLTCERGVLFQVRLQGIPVDPTEWLSQRWYNEHVDRKIEGVKRKLGIVPTRTF
ncbi:peptidoglycan DD-metalloendopeptidase family protein [bacterium]|nr:peptidoglycan DD-metalloendopeptidase family protein [bacterium]